MTIDFFLFFFQVAFSLTCSAFKSSLPVRETTKKWHFSFDFFATRKQIAWNCEFRSSVRLAQSFTRWEDTKIWNNDLIIRHNLITWQFSVFKLICIKKKRFSQGFNSKFANFNWFSNYKYIKKKSCTIKVYNKKNTKT